MRVQTKLRAQDTEGVWHKYGDTDVEFLIARAGTPHFLRISDKHERPFRKQIARGTLGTDKQVEIMCNAMGEGILLGWKGLADEDGKPLEYSAEMSAAVLRLNRDLREWVTEVSDEMARVRDDAIEETAKKSDDTSLGTTSTEPTE